ncbi:MAG: multidrug effflux MFS transporter [Gammaproteobacteria bacterium]|nr:multidrug effflux MFS transporter [Gammaproteobacteria bacterium]
MNARSPVPGAPGVAGPVSRLAPRGLIGMLAAVTATGPLAMQIFLPALPAVQAEFGVSAGIVQLTLSLSMVAIALSTLAYGPLSDRHGRRPVLLAGLVLFLAGTGVCALAPDVVTLIVGRIIQAAGGAAGMVLARAVVRDVYGQDRAAGVIAQLTMVMVVAPMVAPAIGGLLTDLFVWRAVFAFAALAGILIAFWVALSLPESHVERGRVEGPADMLRGFALLLGSVRFCGYVGHTAFSSVIFFSFISGAPYLMVNTLGRPATEYGLWFVLVSAGFMAGNFLAIRLSGRFPQIGLMLAGSLAGVLGILVAMGVVLMDRLSAGDPVHSGGAGPPWATGSPCRMPRPARSMSFPIGPGRLRDSAASPR